MKTHMKTPALNDILELARHREPDFNNILEVLDRKKTARPVLYELFLNDTLFSEISGPPPENSDFADKALWLMRSFRALGYDYFSLQNPPDFFFPRHDHASADSLSQNDMVMIRNKQEFDAYPWPCPQNVDYSFLDRLDREMLPGMKAIPLGPGGVLENTTDILGFDNMCYLLYDDPGFLGDVFNRVGEIILAYYEKILPHDCVGAVVANDDWGFATQTMLPPDSMRRYVIPWHKKIALAAHKAGKPCLMHSCGNLEAVMDDVIDEIGHDGKHSFEDKIIPIEEALDLWGGRIALLGGIDVDFICRADPETVYNRAKALLEKSENRGYALGTGNSVPEYIPRENYLAMVLAALEPTCCIRA